MGEAVRTGAQTLEVRWILPGRLDAGMIDWFSRFPATAESREDTYLLTPRLPGLSVKIRGGASLDVKDNGGSPGILSISGRARGRLEFWRKWTFPVDGLDRWSTDADGWRRVRKERRISLFVPQEGGAVARRPGAAEQSVCAVELSDVWLEGRRWWTLGFEAAGPSAGLRGAIEATAHVVFEQALPPGIHLEPEESGSYSAWLADLDASG